MLLMLLILGLSLVFMFDAEGLASVHRSTNLDRCNPIIQITDQYALGPFLSRVSSTYGVSSPAHDSG